MVSMKSVDDTVMRFLQARLRENDAPGAPSLTAQTAVFDEGLLDSLSLLELVAQVEAASGQTVDMLRFDPSSVETVADLCAELSAALGT